MSSRGRAGRRPVRSSHGRRAGSRGLEATSSRREAKAGTSSSRREAKAGTSSSRREARREELLDAAIRAIRREGASASMDAIAAEAGITKPILYRYFGDRAGLARLVAQRFSSGLQERLRSALSLEAGPHDVLVATIDAFLAFVESDPEVYRFLVQRALSEQAGAHEALTGFIRDVAGQVAIVIGEELRAAGRDSGPAEVWAHGLVGMMHLAGDWWIEHRSLSRERLVEYLSRLVWSGLSGAGIGGNSDGAGA